MAVRAVAAAAAAVALLVHAAAAQRQPIYHWWPTTSQSQDPSGVLQTSDGRWHVFPDCAGAPYNFSLPYTSGLMWCHFSSLDLVHWDEHPPALAPNSAAASADVFTGSIVRLPNGSHWAIFATVNKSSHNTTNPQHPHGTFCTGNIASAISHDPLLETWEQQGTVIDNAMGTPNAPPGVDANFCTLQDPTTPWLGACSAPAAPGAQCWNVVLGSGNNNASSPNFGNLGLLYRTRSATDLRHWHYVSVLFKSAHTPYFGPGYLFSCPDFFKLAGDTYIFQASENPYSNWWIGTYNESEARFFPSTATPSDRALTLALGDVPKSGALGGASGGGRRLNWGFISTWMSVRNVRKLQCGAATMPCVRPAPDHGQSVMSLPLEMMLQNDGSAAAGTAVSVSFVKELEALRVAGTRLSWSKQPASARTRAALPTHGELQALTDPACCSSRHYELNATLMVTPGARSGLHLLTTPALPAGRGPITDFAFRGSPLAVVNDTVHSYQDCATLCEQDKRCMSWTYVPSGPYANNPYKVRCELKSSVGALESWMTMVTGLSSRAPNATTHEKWESVLVGYDALAEQVFISRDMCGHSMTDLPEMPDNPFWRTFTNLTLAAGEDLELQVFVDGPLIELVANRRAVLSVSVWPSLNVSASLGAYGGAAIEALEYHELGSNLRPSDLAHTAAHDAAAAVQPRVS